MKVSSLQVRLSRNAGELLKTLRFMEGREVRLRVVRGGETGETALLRMGEQLFEGRIQGRPLRENETLFARIVREGASSFRLALLKEPAASPGARAERTGEFAFPLSPRFLAGYGAFLRAAMTTGGEALFAPFRPDARGKRSASGAKGDENALLESLLERLPPRSRSFVRSLFGNREGADFRMELLLYLDVVRESEEKRRQDSATGEEKEGSQTPEEFLAGTGQLSRSPHTFFLLLERESTGRVGVLLVGSDAGFRELSIHVTPFRKETVERIREQRTHWETLLREMGIPLRGLGILELETLQGEGEGEGASLDWQA